MTDTLSPLIADRSELLGQICELGDFQPGSNTMQQRPLRLLCKSTASSPWGARRRSEESQVSFVGGRFLKHIIL